MERAQNKDYEFFITLVNLGLYDSIKIINRKNIEYIYNIFTHNHSYNYDCYCPNCKRNSIFNKVTPESLLHFRREYIQDYDSDETALKSITFQKDFSYYPIIYFKTQCNRCKFDLFFCFMLEIGESENHIKKIGQSSSVADLSLNKISKYEKLLEQDFVDFKKALGLYSHSVGIGSYVYLRRILENLIEEEHEKAMINPSWNEEKYNRVRVSEKLEMLKEFIDEEIIEYLKPSYSILSKGMHELSEKECLNNFDVLKNAIEIILDKKLFEKQRKDKLENIKQGLNTTKSKLA